MKTIHSLNRSERGQLQSSDPFQSALSFLQKEAALRVKETKAFNAISIETPLGPMIAIADEKNLFLLEFLDRQGLYQELKRMQKKLSMDLVVSKTEALESLEGELFLYFSGQLQTFKTPLQTLGTPFQKRVWEALQRIPYGQTQTYLETAKAIEHPKAVRAAAQANGANQLALVIPCHRVIQQNLALGGYAGGKHRKEWLLKHERRFLRDQN